MPSSARAPAIVLACVAALACRAREATRPEAPESAGSRGAPALESELARSDRPSREPRALPADAVGAHELRTHAGSWLVRWKASIDPIVVGASGETFSVDAWVSPAEDPSLLADGIALDVDAGMPQHGHGMSRLARVTQLADGRWRAEGLRFHMIGAWELVFDVTKGAKTERARAEVVVE